jgi:hypothetical protein
VYIELIVVNMHQRNRNVLILDLKLFPATDALSKYNWPLLFLNRPSPFDKKSSVDIMFAHRPFSDHC